MANISTIANKSTSKTLFVGNLHASLEESDLLNVFKPFGNVVECCKKWCHYGFIQFSTEAEAKLAYANLNGSKLRGRYMRIEFQRKKIKNIQALIEAEIKEKIAESNMTYDTVNPFLNSESLIKYFEGNNKNASKMSENLHIDTITPTQTISEINNNFDELINKILSQDTSISSSISLASSSSSSASSSSSLFSVNIEETGRINDQILKPILLKVNEPRARTKTSSNKSNANSNKENSFPTQMQDGKNDASIVRASKNSGNSLQMQTSCKNLIFKSINSSNTIFIQPHDVLTPLSEGEFREYKLFPIIQN